MGSKEEATDWSDTGKLAQKEYRCMDGAKTLKEYKAAPILIEKPYVAPKGHCLRGQVLTEEEEEEEEEEGDDSGAITSASPQSLAVVACMSIFAAFLSRF